MIKKHLPIFNIKNIVTKSPTVFFILFILISLLLPAGNKFDTAQKFSVTFLYIFLTLSLFLWSLFSRKKDDSNTFTLFDKITVGILSSYAIWFVFSFLNSKTATFGFTEMMFTLCSTVIFISSVCKKNILDITIFKIGAILLLIANSFWGYFTYFFTHHNRAFGFFYNPNIKTDAWPNAFALFILLTWPFLFYEFIKNKTVKIQLALGTLLSFVFATFFLTFSRAAFITFFIQIFLLLVYALFSYFKNSRTNFTKNIPWKKISITIFSILLTFTLIQIAQYGRNVLLQKNTLDISKKMNFEYGEEVTSVQERLNFWKGAVELSLKEPIFGFGPMSFGYVYRSIQPDWLSISDHPHNFLLKISSENGIIALMLFVTFLSLVFIKAMKNITKIEKEQQTLLVFLLIGWIGCLIHNLVDYNLNFGTNVGIFWALTALIYQHSTPNIIKESTKKENTKTHFIFNVLITSILLFFTIKQSYFIGISFLSQREKDPIQKEAYLKIYEQTFFSRYFFWEQADKAFQKGNYNEAEKSYLTHLQKNQWDAMTYNRLGELYLQTKQYEKAEESFQKAIKLDPKNNWSYYVNLLKTLEKTSKEQEIQHISEKILLEMKQYLPKVKRNLHFTAQQQSSLDAISALQILLKHNTKDKKEIEKMLEEIKTAREKYKTDQN